MVVQVPQRTALKAKLFRAFLIRLAWRFWKLCDMGRLQSVPLLRERG